MCMNCGCGLPEERHGNAANITASDLRRAGEANGQSLEDTVRNIQATAQQLGRSRETTAMSGTAGSDRAR